MYELLTGLELAAILSRIGIRIAYRAIYGGPWHTSKDNSILEFSGLILPFLVTNPITLLVTLAVSTLLSFSEPVFYTYVLLLNVVLGILGGWVWVVVFCRPIKPSESSP